MKENFWKMEMEKLMEKSEETFKKMVDEVCDAFPLSIILTFFIAIVLGWYLVPLFFQLIWNYLPESFVPDFLTKLEGRAGYQIHFLLRALCFFYFFIGALHFAEERHFLIVKIFGFRLKIFLNEGLRGTLFPRPFVTTTSEEVREITIGLAKDGGDESISVQSRDDSEMTTKYSGQVQIFDPIEWVNRKNPLEAIRNMLIAQLRIISELFNSGDLNKLKGAITGILLGKSYVIWRDKENNLIKDFGGNPIHLELDDNLEPKDPEAFRKAKSFMKGEEGTDYQKEIIPPSTFENQALINEATRIGAEIKSLAIKDITPPEEIRAAGLDKRKEVLQGEARKVEAKSHRDAALITMGEDPEDPNLAEKMDTWPTEKLERYDNLRAESRIQEKQAREVVIRRIGKTGEGGSEAGDSILAASQIKD